MNALRGFVGLGSDDGGAAAAPPPAAALAPAPSTSSVSSFFGAATGTTPAPAPAPAASTSFFGGGGGAAASSSSVSGGAKAPTLASVQAAVTGQDPEEAAWEARCALTRTQRMYGFGSCLALGCLISFLSTFSIAKPVSFALLYSLGNIVAFCSTGFLVGPKRQCKMACDASRRISTCIFLSSMLATLLTALLYHGSGVTVLCIFLILIQFLALVWYTASYIPFAQAMIVSTCKACAGRVTGGGGG